MAKQILHVTDPRKLALYPLRTRKQELLKRQADLANMGKMLPPKEQKELARVVAGIAEALEASYTVECHAGDCERQIDIRHDSNVEIHASSIRIHNGDTDRDEWIYPPNIGTIVLCLECFDYTRDRLAEQRVEIDV